MDHLVTIIGNATVDPIFRKELFKDPLHAISQWGFQLSKGETEMLTAIFVNEQATLLEDKLVALQNAVCDNLTKVLRRPCIPPCALTLCPQSENVLKWWNDEIEKLRKEQEKKQKAA